MLKMMMMTTHTGKQSQNDKHMTFNTSQSVLIGWDGFGSDWVWSPCEVGECYPVRISSQPPPPPLSDIFSTVQLCVVGAIAAASERSGEQR